MNCNRAVRAGSSGLLAGVRHRVQRDREAVSYLLHITNFYSSRFHEIATLSVVTALVAVPVQCFVQAPVRFFEMGPCLQLPCGRGISPE